MSQAGVYIYRDKNNDTLYVGQTENMRSRMAGHRNSSPWFCEVAGISFIPCQDSTDRLILEREVIRSLKPKYNVRSRWLPSNDEIDQIHYVFTPCSFYDCVKSYFGLSGEDQLSNLLGISRHHIQMVRMKLCMVTEPERIKISKIIGCTPVDVKYKIGERSPWRGALYLMGR